MKNPVTTISGVLLLVLSALAMFNVITAEQSASISEYAGMLITAVVGLINVFKAGDKGGV
jgi:hypothetical protein